MKKKKEILCTLGPSSLNKKFLKFTNKKISLLRLNMSHINVKKLEQTIKFIRKFSNVPICIDTEGAQIRTKTGKKKYCIVNQKLTIYKDSGNFRIYPSEIFSQLKKKDKLDIGTDGLKIEIIKRAKNKLICKILNSGLLENNKGVHLINRKIKLNFITKKDAKAINIAKKMKINHFALSFTNSKNDISKFNKLLANKERIFKIETQSAINNLNQIISAGKNFLIDRGDLSKEISIEMIPIIQRKILKIAKEKKRKVYVATNFLESMIKNHYPTRAEVNDIYNTLELGATGLVLAAETAIGKFPEECVNLLRRVYKTFR